MLVKQVLSRSMRVWIFAVALLVGEVFCSRFSQHEVNQLEAEVKEISIIFMYYQIELNAAVNVLNPDAQWVTSFISEMNNKVEQGEKLLTLSKPLMKGSCDEFCGTDDKQWDSFPFPVGPNWSKVARVRGFGNTLTKALDHLRNFAQFWGDKHMGDDQQDKFKAQLSILVTNVSFPYIDSDDRYDVNLPKETIKVSWRDVCAAHKKMKRALRRFVPDEDAVSRGPQAGDVARWFLRYSKGQMEIGILHSLDKLFKKNFFYRLTATQAHTLYIEDHKDAMFSMRTLQFMVRKLHIFAKALTTIMQVRDWVVEDQRLTPFGLEMKLLRELDPTVPHWNRDLVHVLWVILYRKQADYTPFLSNTTQISRSYPKVFAELEEMSNFYRTYYFLKQNSYSNLKKAKHYVNDLLFLHAFMDENLKKLSDKLSSKKVRQVCRAQKDWIRRICRKGKMITRLCSLSDAAAKEEGRSHSEFAKISTTKLEKLKLVMEGTSVRKRTRTHREPGAEVSWTKIIRDWLQTCNFTLKDEFLRWLSGLFSIR